MTPPPVIVSRYAPAYKGGLPAYQRLLAGLIPGGTFLAQEPTYTALPPEETPPPWPVRLLSRGALGPTAAAFERMASRPALHPLLEKAAAAAWRMPRDIKPGAVHFVGTGWHFSGFAAARWARRLRVPFTVWPAVHPGVWGDDRIDLKLYAQADAVFCQSRFEAEHLAVRGLEPKKAVLCGLPPMCRLDGDGERLRARLGLGSRPAVLFMGRRDEGKGYPALLKAWESVVKAMPEAVLLLSGPGGEDAAPGASRFPPDTWRDLGVATEEEKADCYAACDLFCLPSAHESFGIVFVEAWAYGKPVICGPAPASRELVEDGKTGLWAGQESKALATQILSLLRDGALARRLGEAGRAVQRARYTPEATLATHLAAWGVA